jgi:hypothetical protein
MSEDDLIAAAVRVLKCYRTKAGRRTEFVGSSRRRGEPERPGCSWKTVRLKELLPFSDWPASIGRLKAVCRARQDSNL